MAKRKKWKLPKTFKPNKAKKGFRIRQDGEPSFLELAKHDNDQTLHAHEVTKCCDCGLTHLHTYSIMRTPKGYWFIIVRAYRVPGTGKK